MVEEGSHDERTESGSENDQPVEKQREGFLSRMWGLLTWKKREKNLTPAQIAAQLDPAEIRSEIFIQGATELYMQASAERNEAEESVIHMQNIPEKTLNIGLRDGDYYFILRKVTKTEKETPVEYRTDGELLHVRIEYEYNISIIEDGKKILRPMENNRWVSIEIYRALFSKEKDLRRILERLIANEENDSYLGEKLIDSMIKRIEEEHPSREGGDSAEKLSPPSLPFQAQSSLRAAKDAHRSLGEGEIESA